MSELFEAKNWIYSFGLSKPFSGEIDYSGKKLLFHIYQFCSMV